jgi:hypothetical protein
LFLHQFHFGFGQNHSTCVSIRQEFGSLLRLPAIFNVNELQEKRLARANTGALRTEISIGHGF